MENSATSSHVDVVSLQQDHDGDRGCTTTAGVSTTAGSDADDPNTMISALAEAAGAGSVNGCINGSSYWASIMNGLMAHNNNNTTSGSSSVTGAVNPPLVAVSAAVGTNVVPSGAAASSPSSSSVHVDQQSAAAANNIDSMLGSLANDPDSAAVWAQDFLHGSIAEVKPSIHACSDDGLQELLYPRTMRELLFSDHNQILNQSQQSTTAAGATGAPTASSSSWDQLILSSANCSRTGNNSYNPNPNFPMGEMGAEMANHLGVNMVSNMQQQPDMSKTGHALLHHHHHHYPHLDDRLSSTTPATSTLSDNTTSCNTLDQWPAGQCEHNPSPVARNTANRVAPSAPSPAALLHQFDQSRVKQEYSQLQQNPSFNTSYAKPAAMGSINPFQLLHQQQQQINQRSQLINIPAKSEPAGAVVSSYDSSGLIDQKPAIAKPQQQQQGQIIWSNSGSNPGAAFHHGMQQNPGADHQLLANFSAASGLSNAGALEVNNYFQPELIQQVQGGMITAAADRRINPAASMPYNLQNMGKKPRHLEGGQVEDAKELVPSDQKANIIPGSTCEKQQQLSEEYNMKRPRVEQAPSSSTTSFKSQPVRKEKLGERITTLQQLVAPFGKTDTASVLLEAIGYIKFLQEQVQALSSPYFKSTSANSSVQNGDGEEAKPDLRSRGLCLVPLSCTMHVANDNGADYWFGGSYR